ncbi:MAG: hypothetical protein A3J29_07815 [Acidobacteria bacterium RIFCSPLOWO2_12_FULL_67_14b]|nr:MAG: hypothetical protein A3J29_07815 [Acidobacteria bacterium RIFCSPLOWO2_12_FULL_67_14b]
MPKPVILPGGPAFDWPPRENLPPQLYEYLVLIHTRLFGPPRGDLDLDNIAVSTLAVDHALTTNRDADGHTQYLTTARHAAIQGNVHGVTADDVGRTIAQWNAALLQGQALSAAVPASNDLLTWTGATWEPKAATFTAPVSSVFGRTGVVVAATNDYTWAQIDKAVSSIADLTTRLTTDVTEGTNLYYTDARARAALSGTSPISYTEATGVIALTTGSVDHNSLSNLAVGDVHTQYLLADGTRGLSAAWDAGSWQIRAETFQSDITTGTAPLTVASTTKVTNLNADLLDDQSGAYYLDAANFTGANWTDLTDAGATTLHKHDHGGQDGLSDDDHSGHPWLLGRSGGQTLIGGTGSGDDLTLQSTSHATKGTLFLDDAVVLWPNHPTSGAALDLVAYTKTFTNTGTTVLDVFDISPTISYANLMSYRVLNAGGTFNRSTDSIFSLFQLFACNQTEITTGAINPWTMLALSDNSISEHQGTGSAQQIMVQNVKAVRHNAGSGTYTCANLVGFRDVPSLSALTAGGTMACTERAALWAQDIGFTATGTVTLARNLGVSIDNLTVGTSGNRTVTLAAGIYSNVSSGTNRWFLFGNGTGASVHKGKFRLGDTTAPTELLELSAGNLYIVGGSSQGYIDIGEYATTTDAAAPADNRARIYVRDNGAGKEQVVARFATGAVQVIATEP